jgi:hypothetical protein
MQNRKKPRRASLGFKLNITTIIVILIVAAGIMGISYGVYCSRVDSFFFRQAEENAAECAGRMPGETIRYFIECINSDAFREVHEKAKKEYDPELVLNWMKETKNYYYSTMEEEYAADVLKELDEKEQEELFSLYSDYQYWNEILSATQNSRGAISPCLQYIRDGKAYYIDDPHYSALFIGTEDTEAWFCMLQGIPCYTACFGMGSDEDGELLPSGIMYNEKEGTYWIYINVKTGAVEEILYSTGIGGNG